MIKTKNNLFILFILTFVFSICNAGQVPSRSNHRNNARRRRPGNGSLPVYRPSGQNIGNGHNGHVDGIPIGQPFYGYGHQSHDNIAMGSPYYGQVDGIPAEGTVLHHGNEIIRVINGPGDQINGIAIRQPFPRGNRDNGQRAGIPIGRPVHGDGHQSHYSGYPVHGHFAGLLVGGTGLSISYQNNPHQANNRGNRGNNAHRRRQHLPHHNQGDQNAYNNGINHVVGFGMPPPHEPVEFPVPHGVEFPLPLAQEYDAGTDDPSADNLDDAYMYSLPTSPETSP